MNADLWKARRSLLRVLCRSTTHAANTSVAEQDQAPPRPIDDDMQMRNSYTFGLASMLEDANATLIGPTKNVLS